MKEIKQDNLGRELSRFQEEFFKNSKIRDESGRLMTLYHGSSYSFDTFETSKIRAVDSDAYYNGFWFSSDAHTLPAWTKLNERHEVYLNVTNPAPMDVVREVIRETRSQWMQAEDEEVFRPESRSLHDEVRYRLQDMGYDGIIHDWKPKINEQELEETGQVKVTTVRGTEYLLKKNEEWGGLDLFYYDKDEPNHEGEHLTGYSDLEDYLSLQEATVVCFRPEQIKSVENRTPTPDPNFKFNVPVPEDCEVYGKRSYTYEDSYGDKNAVYPKLNFYLSDNNLYLGLSEYDTEFDYLEHYCDVTVNIDTLPYLHAAIDTNNNGTKIVDFLIKNGFGEPTGGMIPSGFCWFPVFKFNEDKLREIDPETFAAYAKAQGMNKSPLDQQISGAAAKSGQPKETRKARDLEL